MRKHYAGDLERATNMIVAERAACWVGRCRAEDLAEADRAELVSWLRQSPLHVKEFLLATVWDALLSDNDVYPQRRVAVELLLRERGDNVRRIAGERLA